MRILSIDPGFERLGIALIEKKKRGEREKLLYSACFKTRARLPFPERLERIGDEIERIIKLFKPSVLSIETLFFNTNQKTAMRVAEVRGAIIFIAKKSGLDVFEYNPLQVKIAITGYGAATKTQIAAMIPKLIKLKDGGKMIDDEIDAIAIGLTHAVSSSGVENC